MTYTTHNNATSSLTRVMHTFRKTNPPGSHTANAGSTVLISSQAVLLKAQTGNQMKERKCRKYESRYGHFWTIYDIIGLDHQHIGRLQRRCATSQRQPGFVDVLRLGPTAKLCQVCTLVDTCRDGKAMDLTRYSRCINISNHTRMSFLRTSFLRSPSASTVYIFHYDHDCNHVAHV